MEVENRVQYPADPFCFASGIEPFYPNDSGHLLAGLPIIMYLAYDLWYRLLTKKKPYHHPERWPPDLIVYLTLIFIGSIGLNWYGYIISKLCGFMLVIASS